MIKWCDLRRKIEEQWEVDPMPGPLRMMSTAEHSEAALAVHEHARVLAISANVNNQADRYYHNPSAALTFVPYAEAI